MIGQEKGDLLIQVAA